MPATAPRMITTPMAISQDIRAKTTPIGPYFLSSEMMVPEKMTEKTASMPTQHTAVATAAGNRARQELLPASRNHTVTPQKPVTTPRPMTASSTGPPAPRSTGPAQPASTEQPTSTASQTS